MRKRARTCPLCRVRLTARPNLPNSKHLDHIIPVAVGGTHTHGNVRIICADCNVRRPKDGSDYSGPVTLWAQGPAPVSRPRQRICKLTCRKGLHPWVPSNIKITSTGKQLCRACYQARESKRAAGLQQCKCGALFPAPGRTAMCPGCTDQTARRAAEIHSAGGKTWDQVAAEVGYGSGEGARFAARRIGYVPAPRPVKSKASPACPDCGQPKAVRDRWCFECTEARAWRAVELSRDGANLREIADWLGYSSITSASNLMKTVTAFAAHIGTSANGHDARIVNGD